MSAKGELSINSIKPKSGTIINIDGIAKFNQGTLGISPINWRGNWYSITQYYTNDAISHQGSSFIAIADNINSDPYLDPLSWQLIARGSARYEYSFTNEEYIEIIHNFGIAPFYQVFDSNNKNITFGLTTQSTTTKLIVESEIIFSGKIIYFNN